MSEPCISKIPITTTVFYMMRKKNFNYMEQLQGKHPIKYITKTTKAAIPIVGYAAFVIYSHYFFHLCGSSCNSSSYVAFCIYGILAITSFKYSRGFTSCALQVASSEQTILMLTAAS